MYFSFTWVRFWISGGYETKNNFLAAGWVWSSQCFTWAAERARCSQCQNQLKQPRYDIIIICIVLDCISSSSASYSHISFPSSSSQRYFLAICWIVLSLRDIKMKLNLMSRMCNREILPVCALQSSNCSQQIVFIERPAGSNSLCAHLQSRSNKSFIVRHHFLRAAWFL